MPRHYQVTFNGKVIGTRTSHSRTYTHAYVMQYDREMARSAAYTYEADASDRKNFDWHASAVAQGVGGLRWPNETASWLREVRLSEDEVAEAIAATAGGFDAYADRLRQRQIDRYKADVANDKFEPYVGGFAGSAELARKAAQTWANRFPSGACKFLAVVPAEEIVKVKRKGAA